MAGLMRLRALAVLALAAGSLATPLSGRADVKQYEAEDATLSGVQVATDLAGFTGTGYVGGFDADADTITFDVDCDAQTLYDLSIRYAGIYGGKNTIVVINGGTRNEVPLAQSDSWETASGGQVLLEQGANTIDIVSDWGYYLIDSISLSPSQPRGPHQTEPNLVNTDASPAAIKLYNYLKSIYGKNILSGQQELQWSDYIAAQTGKTPALVSEDLIDYSPSRVERGTVSHTVEDAMTNANRGGIVSVMWHWNAPTGLYDTPDHAWWSGFYTDATDFNIATALADDTNANYTLIIRDLDAIAVQLKRLQDANIPIIWRPLHEAEGGWFWWGAQGPEACKKLYALMYDRFTNFHGLNNMIWLWNSVSADWYPGDATVDLVSTDVYATGNGPMSVQYNQLITLGNDKKMIGAAEVGSAPKPDLLQLYGADWLWFCVWGDTFINSADYNPPDVLKEIYESDYVLTLDEVQGWNSSCKRKSRKM